MTSKHTPEPWVLDKAKWGACQWGAFEDADRGEPNLVGDVLPAIMHVPNPDNDEHDWTMRSRRADQQGRTIGPDEMWLNMARIVACVNALAGIPEPAAYLKEQADYIERLEAELTQARADARVLAAWHQRRNHADQVWTCSTEEAAALERNKP